MDNDVSLAVQIQQVINSLQQLQIPATFDNMDHLLGCMILLNKIKTELEQMNGKEQGENQNGTGSEPEKADSDNG